MIIMTKWYSLLAHPEGWDVLFDIYEYVTKISNWLGRVGYSFILSGYFIWYKYNCKNPTISFTVGKLYVLNKYNWTK